MSEKIRIFTMGGTIDKIVYSYEVKNYAVGDPQIKRILDQSNIRFAYEIEEIVRKDSLDLNDRDREKLLEKVSQAVENKIIITHGTDTIPETAKKLKDLKEKTIVFTGSMFPAKFIDSDATFNIGGAVLAAQILPAGLYLVMNGRVFDPLKVKKDQARYDYIGSSSSNSNL